MPPKKHTRSEDDANQASTSSNKRQKKTNEGSETAPEGDKDTGGEKHAPFEYLTLPRPMHDFEKEASDENEEEGPDEDEIDERYQAQFDTGFLQSPIAEHPDHKWFAFWQTWKLLCDWRQAAGFCDPDLFGMYVYNDFAGYGLQEVVERMMVAFDDQFKKKGRDEDTVKHMWAVVSAMAHWLMTTELGPWIGCEDGDRIMKTVSAIGTMFLTALNELDKAGLLKADSPIKDLGLVMAVYLEWSSDLGEYGLDEDDDEDEEKPSWRASVVAYAKKAGVDLGQSGVFSADELVSSLEEDNGGSIAPLAGQAKADRWGWKKTLASLKKLSPKFGGKEYDITQWTRAERAKHAFDKKDPLANIPEKELKAGNVKMA